MDAVEKARELVRKLKEEVKEEFMQTLSRQRQRTDRHLTYISRIMYYNFLSWNIDGANALRKRKRREKGGGREFLK